MLMTPHDPKNIPFTDTPDDEPTVYDAISAEPSLIPPEPVQLVLPLFSDDEVSKL